MKKFDELKQGGGEMRDPNCQTNGEKIQRDLMKPHKDNTGRAENLIWVETRAGDLATVLQLAVDDMILECCYKPEDTQTLNYGEILKWWKAQTVPGPVDVEGLEPINGVTDGGTYGAYIYVVNADGWCGPYLIMTDTAGNVYEFSTRDLGEIPDPEWR